MVSDPTLYEKFCLATDEFYAGNMSVKEYKGISGGMGSYAQRGAEKGMVRLRLAGGRITKPKLDFICQCLGRYNPNMVHFTTCQSVQLHGLGADAVKEIVKAAPAVGIRTFGGGGDYPRNVTATPLAGLIPSSRIDVMPYAQAVEDYLMDMAAPGRLPRKLKVGFSCTAENIADATARDLGFVATKDGLFDVYSGGGLGKYPRLGLLVDSDVDPGDVLAYVDAMFRMFSDLGNYEDRSRARVRYMRDTLTDEGYLREFRTRLQENLDDPAFPKLSASLLEYRKEGDGSVPSSDRAKPQSQEGLFYVAYHPVGGDPKGSKVVELRDCIADMEDVEVRISPNQTMYVVNLTGSEADRVCSVLSDGAATVFESSVSCVGANICQVGLRDSTGLLRELIEMERRNGFADKVLPMIRISGCTNSCAAHQLGTISLCGTASIDKEAAFKLFANGSHILGKEKIGLEVGDVKASDLPAFFEAVGKAVQASGLGTFKEWYNGNLERLKEAGADYIVVRRSG